MPHGEHDTAEVAPATGDIVPALHASHPAQFTKHPEAPSTAAQFPKKPGSQAEMQVAVYAEAPAKFP